MKMLGAHIWSYLDGSTTQVLAPIGDIWEILTPFLTCFQTSIAAVGYNFFLGITRVILELTTRKLRL